MGCRKLSEKNMKVSYKKGQPHFFCVNYSPYGKELRAYHNGEQEKFLSTHHERDTETGLDYRGARFYDSDVARFLSLDPLAADFASWSPYNYVLGNPISLVDEDGRAPGDPKLLGPIILPHLFSAVNRLAQKIVEKIGGGGGVQEQRGDGSFIHTVSNNGSGANSGNEPKAGSGSEITVVNIDMLMRALPGSSSGIKTSKSFAPMADAVNAMTDGISLVDLTDKVTDGKSTNAIGGTIEKSITVSKELLGLASDANDKSIWGRAHVRETTTIYGINTTTGDTISEKTKVQHETKEYDSREEFEKDVPQE